MDQNILWALGALLAGLAAGFVLRRQGSVRRTEDVERELKARLEEAQTKAREILVEAKDKAVALLEEAKRDERARSQQLDKTEERLVKREESLEREGHQLATREKEMRDEAAQSAQVKAEAVALTAQATAELERLSGMTVEAVRAELQKKVETDYRQDLASSVARFERDREDTLEKRAVDLMTTALHRYARSHVADMTSTVFTLPSEEIKGKIIGREGRNIRTLERLTGVEVIMDETPDSIVFSSFDPLRREIAKVAMEKLIKDGRIQPAKIEEKVAEAQAELAKRMQQIGEQAALDVGVVDFPKEILQLLGRLHFRTSYGQNVLVHSVEMAHVSGMLAAELGANVEVAKKGALVHDIGKAISHEVEGTHVELGRKLLKKYGVADAVIKAMESHHEEYPFASPEAFIVTAADVLSAGRPGARRDTVENYLKRLEDLEKIVNSFTGVRNSYALSAGREIRVFVVPEKVDDFAALQMAKDIAARIQSEMKYPGEIKVNVIREMRAVEFAR